MGQIPFPNAGVSVTRGSKCFSQLVWRVEPLWAGVRREAEEARSPPRPHGIGEEVSKGKERSLSYMKAEGKPDRPKQQLSPKPNTQLRNLSHRKLS